MCIYIHVYIVHNILCVQVLCYSLSLSLFSPSLLKHVTSVSVPINPYPPPPPPPPPSSTSPAKSKGKKGAAAAESVPSQQEVEEKQEEDSTVDPFESFNTHISMYIL